MIMKYSKSLIKALYELSEGGMVYSGRLGKLADVLYSHGHFTIPPRGGSRTYYKVKDTEAFKADLASMDDIFRDLQVLYKLYESSGHLSRGEMSRYNGNSKIEKRRTFNGFLVNSYKAVDTTLNGQPYIIYPTEGTYVFIYDWKKFSISENIVIIGIENCENFEKIRLQKLVFEDAVEKITGRRDTPILFVSRYPLENSSADLRNWLLSIPNKYIHYGDFDLKGIDIFHTEYYKFLGNRSSFLIPNNIENLIKDGSRERWDAQFDFRGITSPVREIQELINLINKYKRCFDQEGLEDYDGTLY